MKARHRATGTTALVVSETRGLGEHWVVLQCAENPLRHFEVDFPFRVTQSYVDVSSINVPRRVPGRVETEPLTISGVEFRAEWEPCDAP